MKYLYILLICLILFYVLTRFYEKYYSQENFDPSLVPVSSIITLAKVAQKIVDGNGTLTNPANLQIGTPTATGNLLITGNTITVGNETVDGKLSVGSDTSVGGNLAVGATDSQGYTLGVNGTLGVNNNTSVGGTLGVAGATTLTGATTIGATGTPATTTSLTVNGAANVSSLKLGGTTFANGTASPDNTIVKFGDGTGWRMKFAHADGTDTGTYIYDNGDIIAGRNLKGGNISLTKGFTSASSATNAELSSDTGSYKNLMILGNMAGSNGQRNIGMWDNVAVSGLLSVGDGAYYNGATIGKVSIGGVTTMKGYGSLASDCTIPLPAGAYKYPIHLNFRWSDGNNSGYNSLIHLWTGTGPSGTGAWRPGYQAGDCCFPSATWGNASSPNCSIPAQGANSTYVYSVEYVGI